MSPTLGMQVLLPYAAKEMLGITNDAIRISPEVLEILGFRIPTEFLSSIEFMDVVGFLPKAAGNLLIVPHEMVAKSGADFDSDELTLYFNHTQIIPDTEGGQQLVKLKRLEYNNPLDHLEALRLSEGAEMSSYKSLAIELFKLAGREKDSLTFLRDLDVARNIKNDQLELKKLDEQLFKLRFVEAIENNPTLGQPTKVIINELLDISKNILRHPLSFEKLIDPVGAYDIKDQAEQIQKEKIATGLAETSSPYLFDMLGFKNLINASHQMWSTLGGTGIFATSATNQIKAQRAGLQLNLNKKIRRDIFGNNENEQLMFEGMDQFTSLSLGSIFDITNQEKISSTIRQYITSSVDGEKNPFAIYINAGINAGNIHMLLNRLGVPRSVVIDFMSQPIINEYLDQKSKYQSSHATSVKNSIPSAYRSEQGILGHLKIKYGRSMGTAIPLRAQQLKEMRALPIEQMTPVQKQLQLQILNDFIRYKKWAEQVRKMQIVTSPDTTKLKNAHELTYLKALEVQLRAEGYFINLEGILGRTPLSPNLPITSSMAVITQDSMLSKLKKVFDHSGSLLEHLDFKFATDSTGAPIIASFFLNIATHLINQGKNKESVMKHLELFDNHLTSYIIQTRTLNKYYPLDIYKKYGAVKINTLIENLFQGKDSLPRRIAEAKRKYPENLFLEELLPILQEYTDSKDFNYYIDKLQLASKNHDHYELDHLGRDVEILFRREPKLVYDLYLYSLLKSGTAFSPTAFFQALPESLLLPITREIFSEAKTDLQVDNINLLTIYEDFLDNNWSNPLIIDKVKYIGSRFDGTKVKKLTKYQGERILYKVKKGTKTVGIHERSEYFDYLYKFESQEETKKGPRFIYTLTVPKGIRGEVIVAGREALLNNHKHPKPIGKLTLTKSELDKLYLDQNLVIKRKYELKEQNYRLNDGKVISLTEINRTSTKKGIKAYKTYLLKLPTQISYDSSIEAETEMVSEKSEGPTTTLLDLKSSMKTKESMKKDQESCKKTKK